MPVLLVAGDKDERAETMPARWRRWRSMRSSCCCPHRTHTNAVTSRAFKIAALDFLAG